jgi:hypothetical protein
MNSHRFQVVAAAIAIAFLPTLALADPVTGVGTLTYIFGAEAAAAIVAGVSYLAVAVSAVGRVFRRPRRPPPAGASAKGTTEQGAAL